MRGLLLAALLGTATTGELKTARTWRIEVASQPGGLEAEMPHSGPYARGIRADAELDFAAARTAYAQAVDEFRRAGQSLWADKASRQMSYSMTLERAAMMLHQLGGSGISASAHWRLPFALCYHEKFLSTRAFLGQPVTELATRAEALYRQILDAEPDNVSARLDLAALYAELGQTMQAEQEFRRVPDAHRTEEMHAVEVARYHAARGQIDEAFRALDRARRRLPHEIRELPLTNSFDRLRRDARFSQLVGSVAHSFTPGWPYSPPPPRRP